MLHLGFSAIGVVVTLLVTIWVYQDAQKRGAGNPILWALGTFFCCPIVPIIYLIMRK